MKIAKVAFIGSLGLAGASFLLGGDIGDSEPSRSTGLPAPRRQV